ncbi:MAG: ATP-binding protein [Bacteroidota bacterium]|nr:ATP-binding protein [Bacteroidota bacterium]
MPSLSYSFFRNDVLDRFPASDAVGKNRFMLFRIFTLSGSAVCLGAAFKMVVTIPDAGYLPWIIVMLACLMMTNFWGVKKISHLPKAYLIMLLAAFTLLHIVAYSCGGIRTGGILYYGVIILYAYMLLGKTGGQCFGVLFAANVIYFYFISTYTDWTSFAMFKDEVALINEDFLINALFTFYLIASQGSYLQSGKNIIIQTLENSKEELEKKTMELERNNFLLQEYTLQLENSNRELDKFASIASHDLKAPLRAIGSLSDFIEIEMEGKLNADSKKYLDTIKSRVIRMDRLLDALLKYSKASRMKIVLQTVNIDKLVEKIILQYSTGRNCRIRIRNILPVVEADYGAIRTVFEILVDNAIRFNNQSDINIEIWSEENENDWIFWVKDNGPGISKQFQDKIFVIFQTLNNRDSFDSTGAGLAIAKRILENKGGVISVDSDPGKGAAFQFTIPKQCIRKVLNNHAAELKLV